MALPQHDPIAPPAHTPETEALNDALKQTVFIVDDEAGILDVVSRGLQKSGFLTSTFTSGRAFEQAVTREVPDICIIDLSIPDFDGISILNELAAQDYRGRILLISGHSEQLLRSVTRLAEDHHLKIVGCMRKPFTLKPLVDALKAVPTDSFSPTREEVLEALRNDQIIVRYQPIVDLPNRQVAAAEALVRWQHPSHGLLLPSSFLNKLDAAGMNELTIHVVRSAFQNRALWLKAGHDIAVAINTPINTIMDAHVNAEISRLAERHQTTLHGLVLEITENEMITDTRALASILSGLCLRGARISLDDFGTGFSSLSRLQRLPIDEVKIDKSFVRQCANHSEDRKIVEAVVALAHALGMRVVAEGVETEATATILTEIGCDFAQGFLFGRPVSPSELGGLIPG
jgi:EAL domain-containing protein (putative c-di-GMP-specific phosphodiesterase class I)